MSAASKNNAAVMSIEDCQRIDAPLRAELELLDYEIRGVILRIKADVERSGADDALFLKASSTVLLSIAAGLTIRAAEKTCAPFDAESFMLGAQNAAQWARMRKLRYFVAGEA